MSTDLGVVLLACSVVCQALAVVLLHFRVNRLERLLRMSVKSASDSFWGTAQR